MFIATIINFVVIKAYQKIPIQLGASEMRRIKIELDHDWCPKLGWCLLIMFHLSVLHKHCHVLLGNLYIRQLLYQVQKHCMYVDFTFMEVFGLQYLVSY